MTFSWRNWFVNLVGSVKCKVSCVITHQCSSENLSKENYKNLDNCK